MIFKGTYGLIISMLSVVEVQIMQNIGGENPPDRVIINKTEKDNQQVNNLNQNKNWNILLQCLNSSTHWDAFKTVLQCAPRLNESEMSGLFFLRIPRTYQYSVTRWFIEIISTRIKVRNKPNILGNDYIEEKYQLKRASNKTGFRL